MDKSNKEYWEDFLNRYRLSKRVKSLRHKFGLLEIGNMIGYSRQYIYGIQEMAIKPSNEFLKKLEEVTK